MAADIADARASFAARAWPKKSLNRWDGYWHEDERFLELYLKNGESPHLRILDLQGTGAEKARLHFYPFGEHPNIANMQRAALEIHADAELKVLELSPGPHIENTSVELIQGQGSVHISVTAPNSKAAAPPSRRHQVSVVAPSSVRFDVSGAGLTLEGSGDPPTIHLDGGDLRLGDRAVEALAIQSQCNLWASRHSLVFNLHLSSGSLLWFRQDRESNESLGVTRLFGPPPGRKDYAMLGGDGELVVSTIEDAKLEISESQTRLRVFAGRNLELAGAGAIRVSGSLTDVDFEDNYAIGGIRLNLDPSTLVQDARGSVQLGTVSHAELNGSHGEGVEVRLVAAEPDSPPDVQGLMIRNFTVPVVADGLRTLGALTTDAAVAIPLLHDDLPGQHNPDPSAFENVSPDLQMDYSAALARLADTRGSPGSVATRAAWLEYRMRHELAASWPDRVLHRAYRLVGYGERPGPAFLAYFVGSVLLTFATLAQTGNTSLDPSWNGLGLFLRTLIDWLGSSLHAIRPNVAGDDFTSLLKQHQWANFGQVLIAVPFITGLLALRKYVKRSS